MPRHKRVRGVHPITPDKTIKMSKRAFDGIVRKWRRQLHHYDDISLGVEAVSTSNSSTKILSSRNAPACQTDDSPNAQVKQVLLTI